MKFWNHIDKKKHETFVLQLSDLQLSVNSAKELSMLTFSQQQAFTVVVPLEEHQKEASSVCTLLQSVDYHFTAHQQ